MTVRLRQPYAGQAANALYTGPDEAILIAIGIADEMNTWQAPVTYTPPGPLTVRLLRPYAGQAVGTTYSGPDAAILLSIGWADEMNTWQAPGGLTPPPGFGLLAIGTNILAIGTNPLSMRQAA